MKAAAALVLAMVPSLAAPHRALADAGTDPCLVPDSVLSVDAELPLARDRLRKGGALSIVFLVTARAGTGKLEPPYSARVGPELSKLVRGVPVEVSVRNLPDTTAKDMLPAIQASLSEKRPALIVWQTGTVDAMRGIDAEDFGAALTEGITLTHRFGADIILMGMQYSLQTTQLIDFEPYVNNMAWIAQSNGVLHFPRYAIMRHWVDQGLVDFGTTAKDERQRGYSFVHGCIARLLSGSIAGMLGNQVAGAP